MTDEEAKRKAWELVNEFVSACSSASHDLDEVQVKEAVHLSEWIAIALLEAHFRVAG